MADITEVRIYKREDAGRFKAYASVTIDSEYVIHGLRVMDGDNGLWVSMPASKNSRGEFKDVFHPISREAREVLTNAVINKYEEAA